MIVVFSVSWTKIVLLDVSSRKARGNWALQFSVQLSRNNLAFAELLRLHPVTKREEVRNHVIDSEKRGSFGDGYVKVGSVSGMYCSQ